LFSIDSFQLIIVNDCQWFVLCWLRSCQVCSTVSQFDAYHWHCGRCCRARAVL